MKPGYFLFTFLFICFLSATTLSCETSENSSASESTGGEENNDNNDDDTDDTGEELTDLERLQQAVTSLAITFQTGESAELVTGDITLPTTAGGGITIDWQSDNETAVADDGTVNPVIGPRDKDVTVTATLSLNSESLTKDFVLTVYHLFPPAATGKTGCFDGNGDSVTCAGSGQDAEFGAGYTQDFTGPEAATDYPDDFTTTDNITGLVWRTCVQGLTGETCTGTEEVINFAGAGSSCSALDALNSGAGYAGITGWRVPAKAELESIINMGATTPLTFQTYFPGLPGTSIWTGTDYAPSGGGQAWSVAFADGRFGNMSKTSTTYAICVAGESLQIVHDYTDNGDGTIDDAETGLTWQKCSMGLNNDAACTGTATTALWEGALAYCNGLTLAGKDWRLPSKLELNNIVDITVASGASIDSSLFPATPDTFYWTSTSLGNGSEQFGYYVTFIGGRTGYGTKASGSFHVRCVSD